MKKQTLDKIKLFFAGISSRYLEQKDFFIKVEFTFTSGAKKFKGEYVNIDDDFRYIFNGENQSMSFENMLEKLISQATLYDLLNFRYIQRGTVVVIEANDRQVITRNEEISDELDLDAQVNNSREYYIKSSKSAPLLKEIGIMTKDGKIKNDMIRKYNQIDHFVEVVDPILRSFSDKETITIMDSGCGKSYLTFVLNYYIKDVLKKNCYFIGVDYKENVITASKERANRLGYKNMEFVREDLRTYMPDKPVDMVISLHACDIATDYAIALAIRSKSQSLVIVPCCHKELKDQIENSPIDPLIKHGIFKSRFNDFLTDSLRALFIEANGYEVTPLEYVSPVDTPKNLMIRAVKKSESNEKAKEEYHNIKKLFNVNPTMERYVY